jgi:peptidoglycan hydrolase CwlO-like protein
MKKDSIEEYRNNITLHLTRMSGDIEHIKEKVNDNNNQLSRINGRLRKAENNITSMKSIGFTLYTIIGAVLTWFGIQKEL